MKEKLGVEVDPQKVKEADQKPAPKKDDTTRNVPWDPKKGTEPFEKRPDEKKEP